MEFEQLESVYTSVQTDLNLLVQDVKHLQGAMVMQSPPGMGGGSSGTAIRKDLSGCHCRKVLTNDVTNDFVHSIL